MTLNTLLHLQRLVPAVGILANAVRFPRLRSGLRVEIEGTGRLTHGTGVRLGEGTRIELAAGSSLALGADVKVSRNVHIVTAPGRRLSIGAGTTIQDGCRIYGDVAIGQRCIFAPNIFVSTGTHTFDALPHLPIQEQERMVPVSSRPIRIFDDCWLGINTVVAPGISVGRGCVLGANAVLTGDLPPYSVAAGNPARILRARLAFAPKSRIDAACEQDAPYFYDGFDLSQPAGEAATSVGPEFELALNHPNSRAIRLCLSGATGSIGIGDQHRRLPSEPEIIEFDLESSKASLPFLRFRTDGRCRIRWAELI